MVYCVPVCVSGKVEVECCRCCCWCFSSWLKYPLLVRKYLIKVHARTKRVCAHDAQTNVKHSASGQIRMEGVLLLLRFLLHRLLLRLLWALGWYTDVVLYLSLSLWRDGNDDDVHNGRHVFVCRVCWYQYPGNAGCTTKKYAQRPGSDLFRQQQRISHTDVHRSPKHTHVSEKWPEFTSVFRLCASLRSLMCIRICSTM